ncbi:hypothetical protein SGLAM104S_08783 [Streptomyces glaucescens]
MHAQHQVVAVLPQERQDRRVGGLEFGVGPESEGGVLLADLDHPPGPVQQRRRGGHGRLDVGHLVAVDRVHDRGQVEAAGVAGGEARVAVGRPLHGGADGVPVAEPDVVAHADLVAVVQDRRARQRQQQGREQLDLVAVVVQQGGESAPDADVGAHARVLGVLRVHVVALFVGDHLQGQLVVVAQEDAPLAVGGDGRGLGQDLRDGVAGFAADGHEDAGHDREVEGHVALVAAAGVVAEVVDHVLRPLVRLREEDRVRVVGVDLLAHPLQELVRRRKVFAVGALLGVEVGHGVQPEAVDAQVEPEPQRGDDLLLHRRVLVVEVRLVREEPVEEVLLAHRVEGPVGDLRVDEDDPRVLVLLVVVGPHVVVAVGAVGVLAGLLEPRVLVAGVVHDEVDDDPHAPLVGGVDELHEVGEVAELRQHRRVVGDVVPAVPERRLEERRQPQAVDAEPLQIVELGGQALEVADAVAVAVLEGTDEDLVEDGTLEPLRVTVLGGCVLEGVRDGLIDDHGVGDPPICGLDGRRTVSTCAGRMPGSRRT